MPGEGGICATTREAVAVPGFAAPGAGGAVAEASAADFPEFLASLSATCSCGLVGGNGGPAAVAVPVFAAGGPPADSDAGAFAVPSKILSYLCAGRTLMLAAPRENHSAVVVEKADAGIVISPDNASDFVDAASILMENAELRARCAKNARQYAERSFDIGRIAEFRRALRMAALPSPIRRLAIWTALNTGRYRARFFGTFALSTVTSFGAELPTLIWPVGAALTYGLISTNGDVNVRIIFDHRITDAAVIARALARLEATLNGPVADELRHSTASGC